MTKETVSLPQDITRIVRFVPGGRYLVLVRLDDVLPTEDKFHVVKTATEVLKNLLGDDVQIQVLVTGQNTDIEFYLFQPDNETTITVNRASEVLLESLRKAGWAGWLVENSRGDD